MTKVLFPNQASRHLTARVGLIAFAALGCGGPHLGSEQIPEAAKASSAAPPAATGTAAASAQAASNEPADTSAATESPFVAVSELPYGLRLFPVDGTLLGVASRARSTPTSSWDFPMGIIVLDRYLEKPELNLQQPFGFIVGAVGSWPAGVDLLVTGTNGRTGIAEHYVLTADAGWSQRSARQGSYFAGAARIGASTLGLEAPSMPFGQAPAFVTLRGPKITRQFAPPDATCRNKMKADGWGPMIPKSAIVVASLGSTRAGTLLAMGQGVCSSAPEVEIWETGSLSSRLHALPPSADTQRVAESLVVTGRNDDDAWLLHGSGYRYDKGVITPLPQLPPGSPLQAAVSAAGELYLLTDEVRSWDTGARSWQVQSQSALHRLDETKWTALPFPEPPTSVASDAAGTVWVAAGNGLFRTRKSKEEKSVIIKHETSGAAGAAPKASGGQKLLRNIRPAGPLCPSNLVVLYGFTKVTPDDFDFPATRKALKGHTEFASTRFVVARDGGQKFFSAVVPNVTTGRKLVTLIEKEVAGSKPQLLCAEPEILRELQIDLATGELKKD